MYATQLSEFVQWLDNDAKALGADDVRDGCRARVVVLAHQFAAFPHCANFSLVPEDP